MKRAIVTILTLMATKGHPQTIPELSLSPQDRDVVKAAYGKLPKSRLIWAVGIRGPLDLSEIRKHLTRTGYSVQTASQVEAMALKGRRLSLLTIIPTALRFGQWAVPKIMENSGPGAQTIVILGANLASGLLELLPTTVPAEKQQRLLRDQCDLNLAVPNGTQHQCVIITDHPPHLKPIPIQILPTSPIP